ncbi:MAG: CHAT domain-containing protein, partial [Methyloceanibacter sp.]
MARCSHSGFGRWAFATALSRLDRHGRTDISSAQSARGLLTASEVAQLKLDADWVILSACNTAAGDS